MSAAMRSGTSPRDIRDVQIKDLLGPEQIATNLDAVTSILRGNRVLITGADGHVRARGNRPNEVAR